MAMPIDIRAPYNAADPMSRLTLRLWWHHDLLDSASTDIGNYIDSASVVVETILDLLDRVDIHCVPGNEWELFHDLRKHCHFVEALLLRPNIERDTVLAGCSEAIRHYCYLLAFDNIHWAAAIEKLCLPGEDTLVRRI